MPVAEDQQPLLIALGSNLPFGGLNGADLIRAAVTELTDQGLRPLRISGIYSTPCFPAGAGPDYVNAAAHLVNTGTSPGDILSALHRTEERFGRSRTHRWAGRTLDLDLIALGQMVLPDPVVQAAWRDLAPEDQAKLTPDQLILPHPRVQDRAFVLVPLADVAPDWRHPATGRTVRDMLAALPAADRAAVKQL